MSEVRQILTRFIENELLGGGGESAVGADDNLLMSGIVDSMGMMRLVAYVDEEFQIAVPAEDVTIENFMSINTITRYVERQKT